MPGKFDIKAIRNDFPILNRMVHGDKKMVYLDSAATTQKPVQVINAMNQFYRESNANIHRGIHTLAEEATQRYESSRQKIADFVGAESPSQIIFTRNTTESINLVAHSWGAEFLNEGDLLLLSEMEHHSNLVPWYMLAEKKNLAIEFIKVLENGMLDMQQYDRLLNEKPKLIAFTHMSNVLGTINPAKELIEKGRAAGAVIMVDGAQSVPHFAVDLREIDPDFYAFSAHKMLGPSGIGVLYGKKEMLEKMPPFLGGGDMIKSVSFDGFTTNALPYKFEAGTPAIAEGIGFGAAVDYLEEIGMDQIQMHEAEITSYAMEMIHELKDIHVIGPDLRYKGGVISFYMDDIHPHDVAQILDSEGVAVRAGHHCAMPLHRRYGIPASTRASFYLYNTKEDVDSLIAGLRKVRKIFS